MNDNEGLDNGVKRNESFDIQLYNLTGMTGKYIAKDDYTNVL